MPENYNNQAPAYHGIKNARYSIRTSDGMHGETVTPFAFSKSISFEPQLQTKDVYANDSKVMAIISDKGYTGEIGTTAQDRALEEALGHILAVEGGLADVNLNGFQRFDFYYEYTEHTASGIPYTVKVWALNLEASKAGKTHNTDEDAPTIGEYTYPITVYGDKIKNALDTAVYTDANGNELIATRVISVPSDTGYAAFGEAVPTVKMAAGA